MREKALRKGTVVFKQGDAGECMYYVRWGKVGVFVDYGTPKQRQLAELNAGDCFGEMGLIDGEPRSATVVVMEGETVLERIGEDEFAEFLASNPNQVYAIIQQLSHKLRQVTKDYLEVCQSVAGAVGESADGVDDASDYHFAQDERLREIHDRQAAAGDA